MHTGLGFRDHSGWAIAVAIGLDADRRVHLRARERIVICPDELPRQPYHAVAEMGFPRETIARVEEAARALAGGQVSALTQTLRESGYEVTAAGIGEAAGTVPVSLDAILRTHTLLHAAEGRLFREALAEAAASHGLSVRRFLQRDALSLAAAALGMDRAAFDAVLSGLGKEHGPPWQKDHREAAAAAILALCG